MAMDIPRKANPKKWAAFLLLGLGFIVGSLWGHLPGSWASKTRVVKAHQFEILAPNGSTRAKMQVNAQGNLVFILISEKGKPFEQFEISPQMIATSKKSAKTLKKVDRALQKLDKVWFGLWPGGERDVNK